MKLEDLIYNTPELTEEKLLEIIDKNLGDIKRVKPAVITRLRKIYGYSEPLNSLLLKEFDNIHFKKSYLTKSERDMITGFVGICAIKMTKGNE